MNSMHVLGKRGDVRTSWDPEDPESRTIQVCNSHHQRLHAALRALLTPSEPEWKTCTHKHRYPEGKAACERRLNGVDSEARKAPVSLGGEPSAAVEDPGTAETGAFSPLETAA